MNEFVSYYRRFTGISGKLQNFLVFNFFCSVVKTGYNDLLLGKQSFSLLYTSINVLAGHYTR